MQLSHASPVYFTVLIIHVAMPACINHYYVAILIRIYMYIILEMIMNIGTSISALGYCRYQEASILLRDHSQFSVLCDHTKYKSIATLFANPLLRTYHKVYSIKINVDVTIIIFPYHFKCTYNVTPPPNVLAKSLRLKTYNYVTRIRAPVTICNNSCTCILQVNSVTDSNKTVKQTVLPYPIIRQIFKQTRDSACYSNS